MNKKKNIFIVASYSKSLINFRKQLLESFISANFNVYVAAPENDTEVIKSLNNIGVSFIQIRLNSTGINIWNDLILIFDLYRIMKKIKVDIVFSYTIKPNLYCSLVASWLGIVDQYSLITGLGYSFGIDSIKQKLIGFILKILLRYGMRNNKVIFFQNPDDLKLFKKNIIINSKTKSVIVNGSGVDLKHFKEVSINKENTVFLFIARLIKDKGVYEYINAAKLIKEKFPNVTFQILGFFYKNPRSIKKEEMIEWQKQKIIQYLGKKNDVRSYIEKANVFVLPSYYREGTPRSILEAMAMGRPIITTDTPGCKETVIEGENGFLVPPRDHIALANAMEKFILYPEILFKMGKRSRQMAEDKYDVHKVNRKILQAMELA